MCNANETGALDLPAESVMTICALAATPLAYVPLETSVATLLNWPLYGATTEEFQNAPLLSGISITQLRLTGIAPATDVRVQFGVTGTCNPFGRFKVTAAFRFGPA